jgi:methylmalonyl-CoA/ethylmalonyl-CoA epimerase
LIPRFPIGQLDQVGIVVRDLEAAMRAYHDLLGVGPWRVYTYGPGLVKDMTYRGRRQDYTMRIALTTLGSWIVELVESIEGPNIYEEFLERHGEGLHHVMTIVDDFDAAVARLQSLGYELIQSGRGFGRTGDGGFAYFDTTAELGIILEVVSIPKERVDPELVYP